MIILPSPLYPVLMLALGALLALLVGSFTRSAGAAFLLAGQTLVVATLLLFAVPTTGAVSFEAGPALLAFSPFSNLVALMLVLLGLLLLPLLWAGFGPERRRGELAVLLLLALTGAMLLPAANHMLSLYVALELLSFPLYILCAWQRDDAKSSEAGLKYFVLGSLLSGIMLFGISLLYAATGALDFAGLFNAMHAAPSPLMLTGAVLILAAFAFKLSLVPFHFYTPDVYEGAPTPITAMLAALPKLALGALLIRLLVGPLSGTTAVVLGQGLTILAMASMVVGAPMAIIQGNLKRLLAFSTIANLGFVAVPLVALASTTSGLLVAESAAGALFYLFIYGLTSVGLFAALIYGNFTRIDDLKGLGQRAPWLATAMGTLLFSLAGIPPLAGFTAKLLAFLPAVQGGHTLLVLLAVLMSVIAAAYSLWLIKVMVFDAPAANTTSLNTAPMQAPGLDVVIGFTALLVVLLGLFPATLQTLCLAAATAIY